MKGNNRPGFLEPFPQFCQRGLLENFEFLLSTLTAAMMGVYEAPFAHGVEWISETMMTLRKNSRSRFGAGRCYLGAIEIVA
jgi:hypothetical protein